jgi:hypothetical protein
MKLLLTNTCIKVFVMLIFALLFYNIFMLPYQLSAQLYQKFNSNDVMNSTVVVKFIVDPVNSGGIDCHNIVKSNTNYIKVLNINEPYDFSIGTVIECKANSYSDYIFDGWSGVNSNSNSTNNNNVKFNLSNNMILIANFKAKFLSWPYFENYASIIVSILGIISGMFFIGLIKKFLKNRPNKKQMKKEENERLIKSEYDRLHENKQESLKRFGEIERQITTDFEQGKLSQSDYMKLYNKIIDYIIRINNST